MDCLAKIFTKGLLSMINEILLLTIFGFLNSIQVKPAFKLDMLSVFPIFFFTETKKIVIFFIETIK